MTDAALNPAEKDSFLVMDSNFKHFQSLTLDQMEDEMNSI